MVFFNYATMQMAAKIVYYGPGLCGKTTNLHHIYAKTSPQSRGEMVSLETETDRTLFFDLLPIDVGVIGGFKTRLQLYTIPGQVFYNTTRKLVLKGVDGLVFVADSQKAMIDANLESFKNLRENLAEIGLTVEEIPLVIQMNKRDLPNIADINAILDVLDPERRYEHVEAVAAKGDGVFETLKLISKLTLRTLRRRMTGEEPAKPAARRDTGTFRVQQQSDSAPQGAITGRIPAFGGTAPAPATPAFTTPAASASVAAAPAPVAAPPPIIDEPIEELESSEMLEEKPRVESFSDSTLAKTADVDARIISDAPVAAPPPPEPPAPAPAPPPPPAPEPEIDFSQTEKPQKAAPDVKHVKVRSSVDVMAELEALRKRATTQPAAKPAKKEPSVLELLASQEPPAATRTEKRNVRESMAMSIAPEVLPRSKRMRVTVSFEGDEGVVQSEDHVIELNDTAQIATIAVDLKLTS